MQVGLIGIVWYREEDYAEVLAMCADQDWLPATFQAWRDTAVGVEKNLAAEGRRTIRAVISAQQARDLARAVGSAYIDAADRERFANQVAADALAAERGGWRSASEHDRN